MTDYRCDSEQKQLEEEVLELKRRIKELDTRRALIKQLIESTPGYVNVLKGGVVPVSRLSDKKKFLD
jgi:flagellar motility protein MotE (MotC chaperone)